MIKIINNIKIQTSIDDFVDHFNLVENQKLLSFIDLEIAPFMTSKGYNKKFTSYGLKHVLEKILGFYISNYQVKVAMADKGFNGKYESRINCYYKLSQCGYKKLQILELNRSDNYEL
jgi:hypothetical protein